MDDVRAQTIGAADIRTLDCISLRGFCRGLWDLTPNAEKLCGVVLSAYLLGSGGVFDCQSSVAAELGFSERTLRNILWGTKKTGRIGLVEAGLISVVRTWRPGADGRPSDPGHLILRAGPVMEARARQVVYAKGDRPRRSGAPSVRESRAALSRLRREAAEVRRRKVGEAWNRRRAHETADPSKRQLLPQTPGNQDASRPGPGFPEGGGGGQPPSPQKMSSRSSQESQPRPTQPPATTSRPERRPGANAPAQMAKPDSPRPADGPMLRRQRPSERRPRGLGRAAVVPRAAARADTEHTRGATGACSPTHAGSTARTGPTSGLEREAMPSSENRPQPMPDPNIGGKTRDDGNVPPPMPDPSTARRDWLRGGTNDNACWDFPLRADGAQGEFRETLERVLNRRNR